MKRFDWKKDGLLWLVPLLVLLWAAAALAQAVSQGRGLAHLTQVLSALLEKPWTVQLCGKTLPFCLAVLVLYPMAVACYYAEQADRYPGGEHGTASWGSVEDLSRRYKDRKHPDANHILSKNLQMATDVSRHYHNLNTVVIGASGTMKTTGYVFPNLMQCTSSYVVLDPKGEILRTMGGLFEREGIAVSVIDLVHFKGHYNPMAYLETDADAIKLAHALVFNTKPGDAPSAGDRFWDDSATMLLSALILYLMYEAPPEEQNFSTLMYMVTNGQISEGGMEESPLDTLFAELELRDAMHPAVLQYKSFKLGAAKTMQSVLISVAANLYMFNSREFAEMTARDETFIRELGLEKRAIFCVISDSDTTFNFIPTIFYTQLFDQLFRLADSRPEYKGRLPVPVRLMMDEFSNVALPQNFRNIISVCRSRGVECDVILQDIPQIKSRFKNDWETILSNCDTLIYLGGNGYSTFEFISKIMGKTTERTTSHSVSRGGRGGASVSWQTAGRDLQTPDEVRRMKRSECLVMISNEDPVIDKKYDMKKHPRAGQTPILGGAPYTMPPDYLEKAPVLTRQELSDLAPDKVPADILIQYELLDLEGEQCHENETDETPCAARP